VNLAEVQTKLVRGGGSAERAWADAIGLANRVEPFTVEQARIAGNLVTSTRPIGLSLGDRACLALAITLEAAVYTTDRLWKTLNAGVDIRVLR
jgi:ribonuclease VapC